MADLAGAEACRSRTRSRIQRLFEIASGTVVLNHNLDLPVAEHRKAKPSICFGSDRSIKMPMRWPGLGSKTVLSSRERLNSGKVRVEFSFITAHFRPWSRNGTLCFALSWPAVPTHFWLNRRESLAKTSGAGSRNTTQPSKYNPKRQVAAPAMRLRLHWHAPQPHGHEKAGAGPDEQGQSAPAAHEPLDRARGIEVAPAGGPLRLGGAVTLLPNPNDVVAPPGEPGDQLNGMLSFGHILHNNYTSAGGPQASNRHTEESAAEATIDVCR